MSRQKPWTPPKTIEEAIQMRLDLVARLQDIQTQLGQRNRIVDGRRMDDKEYWEWRSRAACANKHVQNELQRLNSWIKAHRVKVQERIEGKAGELDLSDPVQVCAEVLRFMRDIADISDDEQKLIDAFRDHLTHGRLTAVKP